ncbi:MAG TPA: acyltransferase family protein [Acidimicrobiales bacterium]|nr:acyltransferase family protein [Acidimicrobiales bacterium]
MAKQQGSRRADEARFTALDGIRAFAVLGVMFFHAGVSWARGGLLGVDVFFVLSGFLITTLLCREYGRAGTIALRAFWVRRARRLVPALLVLLLGVALYAHVYASSTDVISLRKDALATLLYVANWRYIFSGQGYFAMAQAPSALLHTWTLGIEEQYYLLWPLLALFVLRRRGPRGLAVVAGVGALASALEMFVLYAAGFSVDRLYYGTDTRAQALLVGSFLAAVGAVGAGAVGAAGGAGDGAGFSILPAGWALTARMRRLISLGGLAGAAVLFWAGHALLGTDPLLYRGGFLLVALSAGAVIAAVVTGPRTILAQVCSLPPLVFVGRISYGLYLYHWPLFLVIDNAHTGLGGAELLGARFAATFAAATLSWFLVETPIRRLRRVPVRIMAPASGFVIGLVVGIVIVATTVPAAPVPRPTASELARAERAQLRTQLSAADAFTSRPIRFLLVGDSIAQTLGLGLSVDGVRNFGVRELDNAVLGCDLDPTLQVRLSGQVGLATPGCKDWPFAWNADVARTRPEVVGLLLGRWEVADHLYEGQWTHVGQPLWDDHIETEMEQGVRILSVSGAKVVLFTMPYVDPAQESAAGVPYPENQPARVRAFNHDVRVVAARMAPVTTLIDLNRFIDPDGVYTTTVDGIVVRWTDGIHISVAGGELVQPKIDPVVARLGLQVEHKRA